MLGSIPVLFAGLWHVLWPFLGAGALVVLLLALAYFSPVGKRYFVEAAVVVAVALSVYTYGVNGEAARCKAQQIAGTKHINAVVNKAVKHTHTKKAKAAKDPWNQKDY